MRTLIIPPARLDRTRLELVQDEHYKQTNGTTAGRGHV